MNSGRRAQRDVSLRSVENLHKLLLEVIRTPSAFIEDERLLKSLAAQGALAQYSSDSRSIIPMSLNHQKDVAACVLGSYSEIDKLRRAAKEAIAANKRPSTRGAASSKAALLEKIRHLESHRVVLLQDLFLLQRAYDTRCRQARNYAASADERTRLLCSKEQREVDKTLSIRKLPNSSDNIVRFPEASRRGIT